MSQSSLLGDLQQRFAQAIAQVSGAEAANVDPMVRAAGDPKFGDYQCNAAMSLAKPLGAKPRDVAQRILDAARLDDLAEKTEIAGPGFINIRLRESALAGRLAAIAPASNEDRVGIPKTPTPMRVVVDYSSPNIAKQMHVGHLRSTIIGDVFVRTLTFLGHEVIRQNHVGDWGTQFGMLIEYFRDKPLPAGDDGSAMLDQVEDSYRAAAERFRTDAAFAAAARDAVTRLQSGDPAARAVWRQLCDLSYKAFLDAYQRLGVLLTNADVCGESFYNDRLAGVVAELRRLLPVSGQTAGPRGELREDQGAWCVFLYDENGQPRFKNPEGGELPIIIQKSNGAYLYATTDLAAMRYRVEELRAQRIIVVTDARQKLHFQQFIAIARQVGWAPPSVRVDHVTFGMVLGPDRAPIKTREGGNIKLSQLLDEAESRAAALLREKREEARDDGDAPLSEAEGAQIARRIGVAAVKYADLRNDRNTDYVFDWDKLLAFQGNTAPYLMYAYARVRSIYRKALREGGIDAGKAASAPLTLQDPTERALAVRLCQMHETVEAVSRELLPHILCSYLYELSADFMRFYESCSVLRADDNATRLCRLRLCDLTARTLGIGLGLLGIEPVERM